jgi:hypothetical protein
MCNECTFPFSTATSTPRVPENGGRRPSETDDYQITELVDLFEGFDTDQLESEATSLNVAGGPTT